MGTSLNMSAVPCSSVADPLTRVHPVIVPIQRSGKLKEVGLTNIGACAYTRTHLPSSTSFLSFHPHDFTSHIHRFTWHSVFDMSRGSLPLDRGSVDTEVFASPTGIVTPSSTHHLVSSSGQPANAQLDPVLATSGLTKVQTEEIFLLTHEVEALCGRLSLDFIQLSHQEALFRMGVQAAGYEKATWGHPDHTMAYYSLIKSEGEGMSER